jgi:type II secretory pathway pseudopilin PulG
MTAQSGFTLIEALATGIISTVLAGAILSLMHLTNDQVKDGAAQIRMEERQRIASEQIRKSAHEAYGAMIASEDSSTVYREDSIFSKRYAPLTANLPEIRFFDNNYWLSSGYKLGPNYLMEGTSAGRYNLTYKAFTIGDDTVFLDSSRSYFRILQGRQGIIANLRLIHKPGVPTDSLPNDSDVVLCLNRDWP